jgi:hypothetical protein
LHIGSASFSSLTLTIVNVSENRQSFFDGHATMEGPNLIATLPHFQYTMSVGQVMFLKNITHEHF